MAVQGRWIGIVGFMLLVLAVGCTQSGKDVREVRLIAARPFESDIPVPAGFALVDSASEDRSTGMGRLYLRHEYRGQADKQAIRNFYREQMPLARWSEMSDGNVKGEIDMRFQKNSESCIIRISEKRGLFSTKAMIQVIVAREERGQTPPATRKSP